MRKLLTIAETFQIPGRGSVVVPADAVGELNGPGTYNVKLRLPDGSQASAPLRVYQEVLPGAPGQPRWGCCFDTLTREQLPNGTEIWVSVAG
ncbi:MAG: hypothetical protein REJ50_18115 [Bordetella sp.]|nr:hypothetical protein [Bordetella sp.]